MCDLKLQEELLEGNIANRTPQQQLHENTGMHGICTIIKYLIKYLIFNHNNVVCLQKLTQVISNLDEI